MIIVFSGTPGTGKTTVSKEFAKKKRWKYVDVNGVIDDNELIEKYDSARDTFVVNEKKLSKILVDMIKKSKNLIIDSHMAHYIPKKYVDIVFVTKCDLRMLKKRLEYRKYKPKKVRENMDAEIFDICLNEAIELKHKVIILDTTHDNVKKLLKVIQDAIGKNKR
ncbi:AAA family ATPase [archaeon]|jgi:adenylate kinase|nr:AAA family ATPase [archaeon]MBT4396734.1 AAA family ATPase [archaeon]MBT4441344.1 AAA family ATPase [archaeon]